MYAILFLVTIWTTLASVVKRGVANELNFCLAAAVWELYTGERLFDEHISIGQVYYMIAYEGWRPPIPEGCPPGYIQLMTACWAADPDQRPRASEVAAQLNKLYAAEKQHYKEEKLAEQLEEQQHATPADGSREQEQQQQQQQEQFQGDQGREKGGPNENTAGEILSAAEGDSPQQQVAGSVSVRGGLQQQQQQQGLQLPWQQASCFGQVGEATGSTYSLRAAGEAPGANSFYSVGDGNHATQESLVVSTCCADTQDGVAGAASSGPGVNAELDMVEDWGSATKSSRDNSDKTANDGARPQLEQGSRLIPGSMSAEAVPVHLEPAIHSTAAAGNSNTAADASPTAGRGMRLGQIPAEQESGSKSLTGLDSISTGTLPPTMASLAGIQLTSDEIRSMRLPALDSDFISMSTGPLPRTMASIGGSSSSKDGGPSLPGGPPGRVWNWPTSGGIAGASGLGTGPSSSSTYLTAAGAHPGAVMSEAGTGGSTGLVSDVADCKGGSGFGRRVGAEGAEIVPEEDDNVHADALQAGSGSRAGLAGTAPTASAGAAAVGASADVEPMRDVPWRSGGANAVIDGKGRRNSRDSRSGKDAELAAGNRGLLSPFAAMAERAGSIFKQNE
jgi:hypothetical protein